MTPRMIAVVCALSACNAGPLDPDAATGGTTGEGGSGSGGAGQGGSSDPTGRTLPGCLRDLFADCPIDGACAWGPEDAGPTRNICFASGARATYSQGQLCVDPVGFEYDVAKPDGSPCFKLVAGKMTYCEGLSYIWTDPAGNVVATASAFTGLDVRCATTGEEVSCSSNCPEGMLIYGPQTCESSTCP
jgi:hypothetical protein